MAYLLVSGYQKSGTTLLQMLLDQHPEINCPPEHNLGGVTHFLEQFDRQYLDLVQQLDRWTAEQGVRYDRDAVFRNAFRAIVASFLESYVPAGTRIKALKDNWVCHQAQFVAEVFPDANFLLILRDPREVAVSLTYFIRGRKGYPEYPMGQAFERVAHKWPEAIRGAHYLRRTGRSLLVRYEDLIAAEGTAVLSDVFAQLGVEADAGRAHACFDGVQAHQRKPADSQDQRPSFVRSGRADSWRQEADPEDVARLEAACGQLMAAHGYAPEFIDPQAPG